jgi:hypothetical protein
MIALFAGRGKLKLVVEASAWSENPASPPAGKITISPNFGPCRVTMDDDHLIVASDGSVRRRLRYFSAPQPPGVFCRTEPPVQSTVQSPESLAGACAGQFSFGPCADLESLIANGDITRAIGL